MAQIARESGVSQPAVSAVLSGRRSNIRISEETRLRVLGEAERLGYDPARQMAARRLAGRRHGARVINRSCALFLPPNFHQNSYFANVFRGILQVAEEEQFDVITAQTREFPVLPQSLMCGDVDGALVFAYREHHARLLQLLREERQFIGHPIVALMHPLPESHSVYADEQSGAFEAAMHLLKLGHRHLLYCFNEEQRRLEDFHFVERFAGFRAALSQFDLAHNEHLHGVHYFVPEVGDYLPQQEQDLLRMLHEKPEITAILAANDPSALALVALLTKHGRRVPNDISVFGFDDTESLFGEQGHNLLSTVRMPLKEIGGAAMRVLIGRVFSEASEKPLQVESPRTVLPTTLQVRATTAPPPKV